MPLHLRRLKKGDPLKAEDINQIIDALEPLLDMRSGPGIRVRQSRSGVVISSTRRAGGGGGGTNGANPFEVTDAGQDESGNAQVQVELESWLMLSQRCSDKQTITGLGAPFVIEVDCKIWLEVTFDETEVVESATIKHEPADEWVNYDSPAEFDDAGAENKRQQVARLLIAYTQAVPDPNDYTDRVVLTSGSGESASTFQLVQCVTTHVLLCRQCFESDTVLLFTPFFAPGPVPPEL